MLSPDRSFAPASSASAEASGDLAQGTGSAAARHSAMRIDSVFFMTNPAASIRPYFPAHVLSMDFWAICLTLAT